MDTCNYLLENTHYALKVSQGFWLENPWASRSDYVWSVDGYSLIVNAYNADEGDVNGVRPVIEILKSEISF